MKEENTSKKMTSKVINKASDASLALEGISMILAGLSNQLSPENGDVLTASSLYMALYAVRMHLEQIAKDLENIEK